MNMPTPQILAAVVFDGLAFGMLLFVMSVGLTVTMGLMNFVNMAHGAFAMLGGYIAVVVIRHLEVHFLLALPAAFLVAAVVGGVLERLLFHRLYRAGELNQVLFTIGLVFVSSAVASYFFGPQQQWVVIPDFLRGSIEVAGATFGIYKIFLIAVSLVTTALLVVGLENTRLGAQIRAAVDNRTVAQGMGINVDAIFSLTFAIGAGLAGFGGALAAEVTSVDPTFGFHYLVYVLTVVAVGGLGSISGSFIAAAILGIFDVAGKFFLPEAGSFLIYILMVVLLFFKPSGLMGKR